MITLIVKLSLENPDYNRSRNGHFRYYNGMIKEAFGECTMTFYTYCLVCWLYTCCLWTFKDIWYVPQFLIIFRETLSTVYLHSLKFSHKNWGYLSRYNLELGILIIPGCCKKNGISMCSNGKIVRVNTMPTDWTRDLKVALAVRCIIH
jgi:hypothetical protein